METLNDMTPQPSAAPAPDAAAASSAAPAPRPAIVLPKEDGDLEFDYKPGQAADIIIKVVGVGGGGGNAVGHMYREGIKDVSFLVINTDRQALRNSPVPDKLQIGTGLGAGAQPKIALKYALENKDDIRAALNDGTEMVFVTAGMGGGTGTGASPIVAQVAHEMGILTIGIVTIPFGFEGQKKIRMALDGVEEIRQWVDALLIVNNDRLCKIYPDLIFSNAFRKADDTLTIAARSISEIITNEGYINLDFADVKTTLQNSGVAIISTGYGEGEGRVTMALQDAVNSPLLMGNEIQGAQRLLFDLCFSHDNEVTMQEIAELKMFVEQFENQDISVIWGAAFDDSLGDKVKIIILASGFDMEQGNPQSRKSAQDHDDGNDDDDQKKKPRFVVKPVVPPVVPPVEPSHKDDPVISEETVIAVTPKQTDTTPSSPTDDEKMPTPEPTPAPPEVPTMPVDQPAPAPPERPATPFTFVQKKPTDEPPHEEPQPVPPTEPTPVVPPAPVPPEPPAPEEKPAPAPPAPVEKPVTPSPEPNKPQEPTPELKKIGTYYGSDFVQSQLDRNIREAFYIFTDSDLENETLVSRLEMLPVYNRCRDDLEKLHQTDTADADSIAGPDGSIQFQTK